MSNSVNENIPATTFNPVTANVLLHNSKDDVTYAIGRADSDSFRLNLDATVLHFGSSLGKIASTLTVQVDMTLTPTPAPTSHPPTTPYQ